MRRVKVAAAAEEDLKEIWSYIAERNAEAANGVVREITGKFAIFATIRRWGVSKTSCWLICEVSRVKEYFIFYQPIEDGVEILRILHGSA